jgi:hypothetical protein
MPFNVKIVSVFNVEAGGTCSHDYALKRLTYAD